MEIKQTINSTNELCYDFVREVSKDISSQLSKEHRQILKQFINFKKRTWNVIDHMVDYTGRMIKYEVFQASAYPIYEQRYFADPESPFRLYDCLKPALPE